MFIARRGHVDTPDNHGPVVAVITWFLFVTTILWVVTRVGTKLAISRKLATDDFTIFTALAFSLGQSIAVSIQTNNGLGMHVADVTSSRLDIFQKIHYASNFLFVGNLWFAKISVLLLVRTISPIKLHHNIAYGVGAFTTVWAVTSEFVAGFQCQLPQPWMLTGNKCINQNAFWTYFGLMNIFTDAALILLPLSIVWILQVNLKRKAGIALCFGVRILVVAASITDLVYLNRLPGTTDLTYDLWPIVLCNQIVQNLGIITACIPYIKPFLESLESGMIRTDDLRRRGDGVYASGSNSHIMNNLSSGTGISKKSSPSRFDRSQSRPIAQPGAPSADQDYTTITSASPGQNRHNEWDAESQRSSSRIIKQTTTWGIER